MRWRTLPFFSLVLPASLSLLACEEEKREAPSCTIDTWEACGPPSADARSGPWPEQRERLAQLADATEQAVAAPERWHAPIGNVRPPGNDPFVSDWAGPVWGEDKRRRINSKIEADVAFSGLFNALLALSVSRSPSIVDEAAMSASKANEAFSKLKAASMFRDPFDQPEPRTPLFSYARAATVMQFLARPEDRRMLATDSSAFLEKRLKEWEEMQRARLAEKDPPEVQEAVDSIGAPEIRRLIAAWRGIESLAIPPISE